MLCGQARIPGAASPGWQAELYSAAGLQTTSPAGLGEGPRATARPLPQHLFPGCVPDLSICSSPEASGAGLANIERSPYSSRYVSKMDV